MASEEESDTEGSQPDEQADRHRLDNSHLDDFPRWEPVLARAVEVSPGEVDGHAAPLTSR